REQSVFAYLRMSGGNGPPILTVANFTPLPRDRYRLGVLEAGTWRTVLDTDAACYGGSNYGHGAAATAEPGPWPEPPPSPAANLCSRRPSTEHPLLVLRPVG